jgi:hypothetical protein
MNNNFQGLHIYGSHDKTRLVLGLYNKSPNLLLPVRGIEWIAVQLDSCIAQ